jgi:hypothetical protein
LDNPRRLYWQKGRLTDVLDKSCLDIPSNAFFDPDYSLQHYSLNQFCMLLGREPRALQSE